MIISCGCVRRDVHPGNTAIFSANSITPSSDDGINDQYFMVWSEEQYEIPDIWANLTSFFRRINFLHWKTDVPGYKLTSQPLPFHECLHLFHTKLLNTYNVAAPVPGSECPRKAQVLSLHPERETGRHRNKKRHRQQKVETCHLNSTETAGVNSPVTVVPATGGPPGACWLSISPSVESTEYNILKYSILNAKREMSGRGSREAGTIL